jgi:hypothetical protein
MNGETIIARAFMGKPFVGRVWGATADTVYICNDEGFQALLRGEETAWPIGAPRRDVFLYEAALYEELKRTWRNNPSAWDNATPWTGDIGDEQEYDEAEEDEPTYRAA